MIHSTVLGYLGRDVETRRTNSGTAVHNFSIASETRRQGEKKTVWVGAALFGDRWEKLAPYLKKGQRVLAIGTLSTRELERDGVKRTSLDLVVTDLQLAGEAKAEAPSQGDKPAASATGGGAFDDDVDIPF